MACHIGKWKNFPRWRAIPTNRVTKFFFFYFVPDGVPYANQRAKMVFLPWWRAIARKSRIFQQLRGYVNILPQTLKRLKKGAGGAKRSQTRPKRAESRLDGGGEKIVTVKFAACTNPMGNVAAQKYDQKSSVNLVFSPSPLQMCKQNNQ